MKSWKIECIQGISDFVLAEKRDDSVSVKKRDDFVLLTKRADSEWKKETISNEIERWIRIKKRRFRMKEKERWLRFKEKKRKMTSFQGKKKRAQGINEKDEFVLLFKESEGFDRP